MDSPDDPGGPVASALLDRFTTVDEQLDETNEILAELVDEVGPLAELRGAIDEQSTAIAELAEAIGADTDLEPANEFPFPMSAEVPEDTDRFDEFQNEFDAPYDCRITRVIIKAPEASQQGVGVKFGTPGESYLPRGGDSRNLDDDEPDEPDFIVALSVPITYRPNVRVSEGNPIRAQFVNVDTENPHFCTVIPFLREI